MCASSSPIRYTWRTGGVFITTPEASSASAKVLVRTRVANQSAVETAVVVETTLLDRAGRKAGSSQSALKIAPGSEAEASLEIAVAKPALWSPESPALYRAVTRLLKNGKPVDQVATPFGIRSLAWSAEKGLLLNGRSIKLAGGSVHHDNGPLGAAAFDRAEERRVELLKAAGYNAVRTSHNPPSPAFLDACDRLGLLVVDEAFDTWKASKAKFDYGRNFEEWWQRDISAMVLRDRNHPSIIFWSIGNEIPEVLVERGPAIAKQLASEVRSLDTSRPLTQAFPTSTKGQYPDVVFSVLDVGGYNYNMATHHAEDHLRVPSRLMMTTESLPGQAFNEWRLAKDNPYILGEFVWTAMDYLGESGIGAAAYGTPEQAAMAGKFSAFMQDSSMIDKLFLAMANGVDLTAAISQGNSAAGGWRHPVSVPWLPLACLQLRRYRPDGPSQTAVLLSRLSVERRRSYLRHGPPARARREEDDRSRVGRVSHHPQLDLAGAGRQGAAGRGVLRRG